MNLVKPKLSIAIPVYNGGLNLEKNIIRIIKECNKKKFKNFFEIVISDNASSDNTKEIISKYKKIILKKKFIKFSYERKRQNLGFYKNLLNVIKLSNSEYIMLLCDDNFPTKNFYKEIFKYLNQFNLDKLGFVPVSSTGKFNNIIKSSKVGYVLTRGSVLSGVIMKKKKISYKYISKNIYGHNFIFINYFIDNGLEELKLNSKIVIKSQEKISDKFYDRAGRKTDYGVIDKIKTIEIFYKNKKINFIEFYISIFKIYTWCLKVKNKIKQENNVELADKFFSKALNYNFNFIKLFILLIVYLRNLF